jgi:hypothetical protein
MRHVAFACVLTLASSLAAETKTADVQLIRTDKRPAYASILEVSTGPAHSFGDGEVRGHFERIVVSSGGLAYDAPILWLETLTYGDEGCCTRLVSSYLLKISDLRKIGFHLPEASTSELSILRWTSPTTIQFRYGDLVCHLEHVGKPKVNVSCKAGG